MKLSEAKIGQLVVMAADKERTEYWRGTIEEFQFQKAYVFFPEREFRRWCNISNLEKVVKS